MNAKGGKKGNIMASAGFRVGNRLPYTGDDVFQEPSPYTVEQTSWEYIPFMTFDNGLLTSLYRITNNSPTVGALITSQVNYSIGNGFVAVPSWKNEPLAIVGRQNEDIEINIDDATALNNYIKKVNGQNQSLLEVLEDVFRELYSFGNCFLELTKTRGSLKMRVLSTYLCRPKAAPDGELYPTHVGVSTKWQERYSQTSDVLDYPLFPNFENIKGIQRSIMHIKFNSPNNYYWGRPDWLGAKVWAENEYRIAKFNQSQFENGFTPSAIITAYGAANNEEAAELVRDMEDHFTGTGNERKMFIQVLRDKESAPDVDILTDEREGNFLDLAALCRSEIITAKRFYASLAGIETAGKLGSNQQIRSEFDILYHNNIRPVVCKVMKYINQAIDVAAEQMGKNFDSIDLDLLKATPVSFLGDVDVEKILTINEQREVAGKERLESDGDRLLTTTKSNANTNTNTTF